MNLAPLIYKHFTPFFREHGFTKKGSTYYKIDNDIAFCITFEFPSCARAWCHILPLYMPTEFVHLSHGNIINNFYRDVCDTLSKYDDVSDSQIDMWAENVIAIFESDVFLFFDSISTPQKLLKYCEAPVHMRNKYLPYTDGTDMLRLQAYTALYLGEKRTAKKLIEDFRKTVLQNKHITEKLVNQYVAEADEMKKMLSVSSAERDVLFSKICEKSFETCFKPKKKTT